MTLQIAVLGSIFKRSLPLEFYNLYIFFVSKESFYTQINCLLWFPWFIPVLSEMEYIAWIQNPFKMAYSRLRMVPVCSQ